MQDGNHICIQYSWHNNAFYFRVSCTRFVCKQILRPSIELHLNQPFLQSQGFTYKIMYCPRTAVYNRNMCRNTIMKMCIVVSTVGVFVHI